jgi:hypothetical protein
LSLGEFEPAAACAENDADFAAGVEIELFRAQTRVGECLRCRADRKARCAGDVLPILQGEEFIGIDATNFARNLYGVLRRIEGFDAADPATGVAIAVPQGFAGVAQRREASKAADDDAIGAWCARREETHAMIIRKFRE